MNNAANPAQTAKWGEAFRDVNVVNPIQSQQIPLSVNNQGRLQNVQATSTDDCCNCGCNHCCECCLIKPASYKDGLYRIDYKIYNISFLIFSVFTIYPESTLYALSESYHGLYLPTTGLIFMFIASAFMFC